MDASFESNGAATPNFRASILAELLRLIAVNLEAVPYGDALLHIMKASGCTEEQVGGEVVVAWLLLERSGLIKSNHFMQIKAGTCATPSKIVTSFIWDDTILFSDEEEGA